MKYDKSLKEVWRWKEQESAMLMNMTNKEIVEYFHKKKLDRLNVKRNIHKVADDQENYGKD